jgi:hypothetical protein
VLRIHRKDPAAAARERRNGQIARGDEALLVREREIDAALQRPHRRGQARETDDGVEDDVGLGALEELGEVSADLRERSDAVERLRSRGCSDQLEVRVRVDDLARLRPDRARRAEQGHALHAIKSREAHPPFPSPTACPF